MFNSTQIVELNICIFNPIEMFNSTQSVELNICIYPPPIEMFNSTQSVELNICIPKINIPTFINLNIFSF